MQKDKITFKLTRGQLDYLEFILKNATQLQYSSFDKKLLVMLIIRIHQKVLLKWSYPQVANKITFSAEEAIAFWLMFNPVNFEGAFEASTIRTMLNDIHKKFI